MTDTFAFHPPPPSLGGGGPTGPYGQQHPNDNGNGHDGMFSHSRPSSSGGPAPPSTGNPTQQAGMSAFRLRDPASSAGLSDELYDGRGPISTRNTRPMTAPSSVSAPYFQTGYVPVNTSLYPNNPQFPILSNNVVSDPDYVARSRMFSLPGLTPYSVNASNNGVDDVSGYPGSSFDHEDPALAAARRRASYDAISNSSAASYYNGDMSKMNGFSAASSMYPNQPGGPPELINPFAASRQGGPGMISGPGMAGRPPLNGYYHTSPIAPDAADPPKSSGKDKSDINPHTGKKKRPRRRFDEIERLYTCDYPGCTKGYGTLNHLNSHKMMQKHANERCLYPEFKELRKAWRENKKAASAAAARRKAEEEAAQAQAAAAAATAASMSPPGPVMNNGKRMSIGADFAYTVPTPGPPGYMPVSAPANVMYGMPPPPPPAPAGYDYNGPIDPSLAGGAPGSSPARPVTAPSFYPAPQFGYGMAPPPPGAAPGPGPASGSTGPMPYPPPGSAYAVGHERRLSLPPQRSLYGGSPGLGHHHPESFSTIHEEQHAAGPPHAHPHGALSYGEQLVQGQGDSPQSGTGTGTSMSSHHGTPGHQHSQHQQV